MSTIVLAANDLPRAADRFLTVALEAGVSEAEARSALCNVQAKQAGGLLVSGRQVAGKDTIAPLVIAAAGITEDQAVKIGVADAIKDEMDRILAICTDHTRDRAASAVASELDLAAEHAAWLVDTLYEHVHDYRAEHGVALTGRTRTPAIRRALQYHGEDARKDTHPGYWVTQCLARVVPALAARKTVYMTDGRFAREVDAARDLGLFCVRLFITPDEQRRRLLERDGIEPDPVAINHPGEIGLEWYDGFDMIVDNSDVPVQRVVDQIAGAFVVHRSRLGRELR